MNLDSIGKNENNCCGCGACSKKCPRDAISIRDDYLGFPQPSIDKEKCINCGACVNVCPFEKTNFFRIISDFPKEAYAVALKNRSILLESASGGAFAGIAKKVIEKGGVVYGAAWRPGFNVCHIRIESISELPFIQKSKYIQSDIKECFISVKSELDSGTFVLFSGTPCQVASLKLFLQHEYNNLLTVDLICHGVGSSSIFKDDLCYLEKKYKKSISYINFRSKTRGWGTSGDIVFNDRKTKKYDVLNSLYYYYYLKGSLFRNSCYNCFYASENRPADFTVGDYWRVEESHPNIKINTKNGISSLIINSKKGKTFFECLSDVFYIEDSSLEKIRRHNGQLIKSSAEPNDRKTLLSIYYEGGYLPLRKFFLKKECKGRAKERLKRLIPLWAKKFFRRHY